MAPTALWILDRPAMGRPSRKSVREERLNTALKQSRAGSLI